MTVKKIRLGTRGSRLAKAQSIIVQNLLKQKFPELQIETIYVKTKGDLEPNRAGQIRDKSAFTSDIEVLLSRGELDIAVHSMKDLPSKLGQGLFVCATPPRGDPRDALVSLDGKSLAELPDGGVVGTSSLRRRVQLLRLREDLSVVELHGNVETRINKIQRLGLNAIVLAACGLYRIGMNGVRIRPIPVSKMIPAAGQGILAVEARNGDSEITELASKINDQKTWTEATCERGFIERIGGDCTVPVAAHCQSKNGSLRLTGMIASPDGKEIVKGMLSGEAAEAHWLGSRLADKLLARGGRKILEMLVA